MTASPALLTATISSALIFGFVISLIGCLRAHWAVRLQMGESTADGLWGTLTWALIPTTLVAGILVDVWGLRPGIWLGSLLLTMSFFLLSNCRTVKGTRRTLILTAIGTAFLGTGAIVAMPRAFFDHREAAAAMNLGTSMFVLGALIAPTLCDILLRTTNYQRMMMGLGLVAMIPAIAAIGLTESPQMASSQMIATATDNLADVLLDPIVLAGAIFFFFYAPMEGTLHRWAPASLKELEYTEKGSRALLSAFWSSFLLSRLLTASLLHSKGILVLPANWPPWVMMFCSVMILVTLGNLMGVTKRSSAAIGVVCLGLVLGPVFPTLVAMLYKVFPTSPGTAFGSMFALGSFGGVLLGPVLSADARRATTSLRALRAPFVLGFLMLISSLVFALLMGNE